MVQVGNQQNSIETGRADFVGRKQKFQKKICVRGYSRKYAVYEIRERKTMRENRLNGR